MSRAARPALDLEPSNVRRIAVLRQTAPELLLSAVPALRALRTQFPDAEITLICRDDAVAAGQRLPWVDRTETLPLTPDETRAPFDLALQLQDGEATTNDQLIALGARVSVAFSVAPDARLTVNLPWNKREHETLRWMRLAAQTGAVSGNPRIELPLRPHEGPLAYELIDHGGQNRPVIGINLDAVHDDARWTTGGWLNVAKQLQRQYNARIVLLGSSASGAEALALIQALPRRAVSNLIDITDIGLKTAVIARLDLLLSADAGALRLADAAGTRSVALFGPTEPERWAPLDAELHTVVDAAPARRIAADGRAALAAVSARTVCRASAQALTLAGWQPAQRHGLATRLAKLGRLIGLEPVSMWSGRPVVAAQAGGGKRYQ